MARLETSEKHVLQVVRNWWMVRMQLPNLHLNSSEARVYDDVIFYCGGRMLLFDEGNQGVLKRWSSGTNLKLKNFCHAKFQLNAFFAIRARDDWSIQWK